MREIRTSGSEGRGWKRTYGSRTEHRRESEWNLTHRTLRAPRHPLTLLLVTVVYIHSGRAAVTRSTVSRFGQSNIRDQRSPQTLWTTRANAGRIPVASGAPLPFHPPPALTRHPLPTPPSPPLHQPILRQPVEPQFVRHANQHPIRVDLLGDEACRHTILRGPWMDRREHRGTARHSSLATSRPIL